jgi:hypothetical protein
MKANYENAKENEDGREGEMVAANRGDLAHHELLASSLSGLEAIFY